MKHKIAKDLNELIAMVYQKYGLHQYWVNNGTILAYMTHNHGKYQWKKWPYWT